MTGELSLFDFFDPPAKPPAPVAAAIDTVHWLVVTTKRARTGCGIIVTDFAFAERTCRGPSGELVHCSLDCFSDRVTCQACREAI